MHNTAVFSVVYPSVEVYLPQYLCSLLKQTESDFTLYLINDGVPGIEQFFKGLDLSIEIKNASGPPAALRKTGIEWMIDKSVNIIVFADADDYFAENRVDVSKKMLSQCDLVVNELELVGQGIDQSIPMLGKRFNEGDIVSLDILKRANSTGLSNTSLCVKSIPSDMNQIPDDIIAFDWAFFTMCLQTGVKAVFTKTTSTFYRQHCSNTASVNPLTEDQIMHGVRVKCDHYQFLSKLYDEYSMLSDTYADLFIKLRSDVLLRHKYCKAVRTQSPILPLWWEAVKTLEELGL